jgi:hypothetical protein
VSGIGPSVGHMEVEHDPESEAVGTVGRGGDVLFAAPAVRRVDPHPQPGGIDPLALQDVEAIPGYACVVVEKKRAFRSFGSR